jgi:deoxyribodipyrimidine photo-lyase
MSNSSLFWFRQDLRLADNPGLIKAAQHDNLIAVYIEDPNIGSASQWWLHHSLTKLNESLGNKLNIYQGDPKQIIFKLINDYNLDAVYWNRCYEPWRIQMDSKLKADLKEKKVTCETFNASLLWEPMRILKNDKTYYKVFTPFYQNGCLKVDRPRDPLRKPRAISFIKDKNSLVIADLRLLPKIEWYKSFEEHWDIGEKAAHEKLKHFLSYEIKSYKESRDFPARNSVSRLSPHLHLGEISPHQVWAAVQLKRLQSPIDSNNLDHFIRELCWREFSYYLLYHFPELPYKNFQNKFDRFPWQKKSSHLKAWQKGLTGYPIIDAGMRELWHTGYMHNRVRMIAGSFLVKNLLIDWREGEAWFSDCLVDADLANNSASWQWVAGSGADAAPYFRIFNPITQGEKFDPEGAYTKRFVPELKQLPNKYLFKPWEAPGSVLKDAGVKLGENYPFPIVDLQISRQTALQSFANLG